MSSNQRRSICTLANHSCSTKIPLHEVKFVWTIENFNFHEAIGTELRSPIFSAVSNPQVKWFLIVGPNGETDTKDTVSFYVNLSSDSIPKKVFAKFSASVLNSQQKEVCQMTDNDTEEIDEYTVVSGQENEVPHWGFKEFLVKNTEFRNDLLVNQKLTIICTIIFSTASDTFSVFTPLYPELPMSCNLAKNLETLLENNEFSDIVLSVKGKEYSVHKNILAARSSVFAAMFKHDFKENETNRIEIEDMNEEIVAEMLRYIYTGKCENPEKLADGLLAAADKYDLDRLKMICAEALFKTLSVDNAANILALADSHGVYNLKSKVIEFIAARFAEVVDTTAWQNIIASHTPLVNEVCKAVAGRSTVPNKKKNPRF